jgi:hypothetical protein
MDSEVGGWHPDYSDYDDVCRCPHHIVQCVVAAVDCALKLAAEAGIDYEWMKWARGFLAGEAWALEENACERAVKGLLVGSAPRWQPAPSWQPGSPAEKAAVKATEAALCIAQAAEWLR